MHNALRAHGRAVQAFRAAGSPGDVGIVVDIWKRHPATSSAADQALAEEENDKSFRFFLDPIFTGGYNDRLVAKLHAEGVMPEVLQGDFELIAQPIDYFGINVYSRVVVSAEHAESNWWEAGDWHPGGNFLDNGLEYYPKAVYDAIKIINDDYGFKKPIFITENGMYDPPNMVAPLRDQERIHYVAGFLKWIATAIEEGVDVRGYYLWSLMDNFEWAAGYTVKYGIVQVNPETMERALKDSAIWYASVIKNRDFEDPN